MSESAHSDARTGNVARSDDAAWWKITAAPRKLCVVGLSFRPLQFFVPIGDKIGKGFVSFCACDEAGAVGNPKLFNLLLR